MFHFHLNVIKGRRNVCSKLAAGSHMHAYSFPFIYFRCNLQSDKCSASRARMHLQPRPTVRTADRRAPSTPADAGRSPLAPKRHGRASTASSPVGDSPVGARRASIPPMPRHGPPGNRAARRRRRCADSRQAATAATHAPGGERQRRGSG